MAWYVFALVDAPPERRAGPGLSGALSFRPVPGGFAVVERRADVPPIEFDTLRQHDAVVSRLADAVPAILPVRFGTLLELGEIEDALPGARKGWRRRSRPSGAAYSSRGGGSGRRSEVRGQRPEVRGSGFETRGSRIGAGRHISAAPRVRRSLPPRRRFAPCARS
jgi:hypothetical protein